MSTGRDKSWADSNEHEEAYDPNDPIPEWEAEWMAREIDRFIMTPEEFLRFTAPSSQDPGPASGKAAEEAAQWWFKSHGWKMFKVEPPSRVVKIGGKLRIVYTEAGYPDFMGIDDKGLPAFCEVKAAESDSLPHSRLTKKQRRFLSDIPSQYAWVGVCWPDGEFEVFQFDPERGAYKRGRSKEE